MIACGVNFGAGSFNSCGGGGGFPVALVRLVVFLGGGLTGLAVWYGFETSGFLGGVTSLMSSVMKSAAFVGLVAGGDSL